MKKYWWVILVIFLAVFGYWFFKLATKPLPGEAVSDDGHEHLTDISGVKYSSNPPSSGKHFPVWAKPGVYDRLISDGYFIHSMEHGYVIIWYDCEKPMVNGQWLMINRVLAHDELAKDSTDSGELLKHMKVEPVGNMSWFTPQNPPAEEIPLPDSFKSDSCKSLVGQLSEFTKVAHRVIVTPRLNMDTVVSLTAWGRIDKLNKIDKVEITNFIKVFENKGPEQTTE